MKEFVEKLIERLDNASHLEENTFDEDGYSNDDSEEVIYLHKALQIVNQLAEEYNQDSTKKKQGWIACTERLPEDCDHRFYMCIVENHEEDLPMFCQYEEDYGFGFWQDFYDEHTLGFLDSEFRTNEELGYEKVIAWQQLPKVYRPEEGKDSAKNAQTRIECIRSMSVEELADAILERSEISTAIDFCQNFEECWEEINEDECRKCLIRWLNSLVEQKKVIPTEHFTERFNRVL